METVDLALQLQNRGVVGVDLCGNPSIIAISHLMPAFLEAKMGGLGITLHFAEIRSSSTEAELKMLLSGNPDRLGHVIHVKQEFKEIIMNKGIGLELCLSCNVQGQLITGDYNDHHFREWRKKYKRIALCVRTFYASNPSHELKTETCEEHRYLLFRKHSST